MGLVHPTIVQQTATQKCFIDELVAILDPRIPFGEDVFITYNGARPHLNIDVVVPPECEGCF